MSERIGIVGGGQLGRMLTIPAKNLGFEVTVLDPNRNCPAARVGADQLLGELTSPDKIEELGARSDFITWEIEHIATNPLIEMVEMGAKVRPNPLDLLAINDKFEQKGMLIREGI